MQRVVLTLLASLALSQICNAQSVFRTDAPNNSYHSKDNWYPAEVPSGGVLISDAEVIATLTSEPLAEKDWKTVDITQLMLLNGKLTVSPIPGHGYRPYTMTGVSATNSSLTLQASGTVSGNLSFQNSEVFVQGSTQNWQHLDMLGGDLYLDFSPVINMSSASLRGDAWMHPLFAQGTSKLNITNVFRMSDSSILAFPSTNWNVDLSVGNDLVMTDQAWARVRQANVGRVFLDQFAFLTTTSRLTTTQLNATDSALVIAAQSTINGTVSASDQSDVNLGNTAGAISSLSIRESARVTLSHAGQLALGPVDLDGGSFRLSSGPAIEIPSVTAGSSRGLAEFSFNSIVNVAKLKGDLFVSLANNAKVTLPDQAYGALIKGSRISVKDDVTVTSTESRPANWRYDYELSNGVLEIDTSGPGSISAPRVLNSSGASLALLNDSAGKPSSIEFRPSSPLPSPTFVNEGRLIVEPGATIKTSSPIAEFNSVDWSQSSQGVTTLISNGKTIEQMSSQPFLSVQGHAQLDGKLVLQRAHDSTVPGWTGDAAVGTKVRVLAADWGIDGRFASFEGATIFGSDGAPRDDAFAGLIYDSSGVDLAVLAAPRSLAMLPGGDSWMTQGNGDKLVLVTHGWRDDANGWVQGLAADIAANTVGSGYVFTTLDWSQYAALSATGTPVNAAINAADIGEALSQWFDERGRTFNSVHLLGHSAGSHLVNELSKGFKQQGSSFVQLTLFDPYLPSSGISRDGRTTVDASTIGSTADFFDNYHANLEIYGVGLGVTVGHAVNFEVSTIDPPALFVSIPWLHSLPHERYRQSVGMTREFIPIGFALTREAGYDISATEIDFVKGETYIWGTDNSPLVPFDLGEQSIDLDSTLNIPTGIGAIVQEGAIILETHSPAIMTTVVDLESPANWISFDFKFLNDAEGLLSFYLNGEQLLGLDTTSLKEFGSWSDLANIELSTGRIWLGEAIVGMNTMLFRLDPLTDASISVEIGNIKVGYTEFVPMAVPEPSTYSLVLVGASALIFVGRFARRGRGRYRHVQPNCHAELATRSHW